MNELLNPILERSPAKKIAILATTIVLLSALYVSFLYEPRSDAITKLTDGVEIARNEKAIKQKKAANLPKLQKDLQDGRDKHKEAVAQLPDSKEIPELLSNISTKAREAGLEIVLFRPRAKGSSQRKFKLYLLLLAHLYIPLLHSLFSHPASCMDATPDMVYETKSRDAPFYWC